MNSAVNVRRDKKNTGADLPQNCCRASKLTTFFLRITPNMKTLLLYPRHLQSVANWALVIIIIIVVVVHTVVLDY